MINPAETDPILIWMRNFVNSEGRAPEPSEIEARVNFRERGVSRLLLALKAVATDHIARRYQAQRPLGPSVDKVVKIALERHHVDDGVDGEKVLVMGETELRKLLLETL